MAFTLWLTIILMFTTYNANGTEQPRISPEECARLDVPNPNGFNRTAVVFNFCVVSGSTTVTWDQARSERDCHQYAYGRLFVVNQVPMQNEFKDVLMNKCSVVSKLYEQRDVKGPKMSDAKLTKADCGRFDYGSSNYGRAKVVGKYCYISAWDIKKWEEANWSCTMFELGKLAYLDTKAKKDELNYTLQWWSAHVSGRAFIVGKAVGWYEKVAFHERTGFFNPENIELAYICQYRKSFVLHVTNTFNTAYILAVEEYICNNMEACAWLLETGKTVKLCLCRSSHTCVALPHLGPGMLPYQRDGIGKVVGILNHYMAYKRNQETDKGLVIGTCQYNLH